MFRKESIVVAQKCIDVSFVIFRLYNREAEMREVSETTNGRVAWYSIMSIGVCITVSVMQVFHLKRYFRKKKLL